ncbi:MAG: DUF11 domain-containing protein [Desulfobacterales bacterium]|nr:DUF11 domain-containing protein [Desulfobacterales bacterium]
MGGVSYVPLPDHSPAMTPGSAENWWSNPTVTGVQTALLGIAVNGCGIAPTMTKSVNPGDVAPGGTSNFHPYDRQRRQSQPAHPERNDGQPPGRLHLYGNHRRDAHPLLLSRCRIGRRPDLDIQSRYHHPCRGQCDADLHGQGDIRRGQLQQHGRGIDRLRHADEQSGGSCCRSSPDRPFPRHAGAFIINPGDPLTYALAWSNPSTVDITNARIDDTLPAGLAFASCGGVSCVNNSGTVTWTLGNVAAGASGTVTLTATVDANYNATSLTNGAVFSAADPAGNPVSTSATGTIAVNVVPAPSPAFTLTKSAGVPRGGPRRGRHLYHHVQQCRHCGGDGRGHHGHAAPGIQLLLCRWRRDKHRRHRDVEHRQRCSRRRRIGDGHRDGLKSLHRAESGQQRSRHYLVRRHARNRPCRCGCDGTGLQQLLLQE